jgi:hypothetical protein
VQKVLHWVYHIIEFQNKKTEEKYDRNVTVLHSITKSEMKTPMFIAFLIIHRRIKNARKLSMYTKNVQKLRKKLQSRANKIFMKIVIVVLEICTLQSSAALNASYKPYAQTKKRLLKQSFSQI